MTPERAWIFAVSLTPCKAEAQFGQLPSPRAARTVVGGLIWPFSLAFGHTPPRVAKKLKLQERRAVIPSRRSLVACRPLGFLGRSMEPFADRRAHKGDLWSGHVSWPTSLGRWTMSCCCGTSIWLLKTGF